MKSNIFMRAAPLLQERGDAIDYEAVLDFLGRNYSSGQRIYPAVLCEYLKLSLKDAYSVMEMCCDASIVEQNLQICCPHCRRYVEKCYRSLFDIPESVNCVRCDREIPNPAKYAYVMYKVL